MSFLGTRNAVSLGVSPHLTLSSSILSGSLSPSLILQFAGAQTLDPRITFTRATTATFTGSDGLIQTAAIDAPRFDYNPVTLAPLGLLIEEQRTNLVLNSATLSTQNVTVAAVAHTLSFYGTGTVTLSGVSTAGPLVGAGAYPARSTLTFTPTAGTLTLTVSGAVQFAQLEAGAFSTSYIPTEASQVTRAADLASMTGANFSSWFNASEGTLVSQASIPSANLSFRSVAVLGRSTNTNFEMYLAISRSADSRAVIQINDSSTQFAYTPIGVRLQAKQALGYATNNTAAAIDNVLSPVDTLCTIPTALTTLYIGSADTGTLQLNGHIQRITYYPRRLADAQLQALTA